MFISDINVLIVFQWSMLAPLPAVIWLLFVCLYPILQRLAVC
jgi:hypothetical protein